MKTLAPMLFAAVLGCACAPSAAQDPAPAPPADHEAPEGAGTEEPVHTNRLAQESSPYLLQHKHNPVDWYPWGDEAFAKAKEEDKPVFLSIGYSTCHWCHVMERESFEDEEVAKILNEHFVSVKVDREERPDVDAVYMSSVQTFTRGAGGWPLTVFLTADRKPFFGGTYFPPEDRFGRPGFTTLLMKLNELWDTRRADLVTAADEVLEAVRKRNTAEAGGTLSKDLLARAVGQYRSSYDPAHGGFGGAPKFPRSFSYSFLLRQQPSGDVLSMVTNTLDNVRMGGIHDHLGGGFHRYSTDREWLVPHFEKMLYDQAYLAQAYLDAFQVTNEPSYERAARGIFEYVLRDLRDDAGAFHSAEDADSEGVEGKFYLWHRTDILEVLGEEDGTLFADVYECTERGNYVEEATRERTGENIPHLDRPIAEHAAEREMDAAELRARLGALRDKLLAERAKRIRPSLDDKVLTDWNGMMIGAFARGGVVLDEPRYLDAAREAAEFLHGNMRKEGALLHRYRAGKAGIPGFLDDYAFLGLGLTDLYQATFDARWLAWARELAIQMHNRFHDAEGGGGYVLGGSDGETLVTVTKDIYDGAIPSGNSAAAALLIRVGRLTMDEDMVAHGRKSLESWAGTLAKHPMGYPYSLGALHEMLGPSKEIVIAGDPADDGTRALLATVRSRFLANTIVLLNPPGKDGEAIRELAPFLENQGPVDGKPAAYVCENYACQAPVTDAEALANLLD